MKKVILFIIVAILVGLLIFRFTERRRITETQTISQIQAREGYPVEVANVRTGEFNLTKKYTGTVVGGMQSQVVSMISEHISRVNVREGQFVEKNTIICELSRDNPSASYAQARLALDNAEKELTRVQKLYGQGAISEQVLDGIKLQRNIAAEALKNTEQLLYLRAPFAGVVTELDAEVGKLVNPGQAVAKLVANERTRVEIQVPGDDRGLVRMGALCSISNRKSVISGKVERVALSADPGSRSFKSWIDFDQQHNDFAFSPGLLVDVSIEVLNIKDAIIISSTALIREGEKWFVYVIEGKNVAFREVDLGGINRDIAWIRDGLTGREQIVISGQSLLFDRAPIRIIGQIDGNLDNAKKSAKLN